MPPQPTLTSPHSALNTNIMAIEPLKKMRRPRFTDTEILTLVEEVYSRAAVILGKLDSKITADRKTKAWGEVAASVNAVGRAVRTADELRRKFKNLRTHVKSKAAAEQRHVAGTGELIGFCYHIVVSGVADLSWCG